MGDVYMAKLAEQARTFPNPPPREVFTPPQHMTSSLDPPPPPAGGAVRGDGRVHEEGRAGLRRGPQPRGAPQRRRIVAQHTGAPSPGVSWQERNLLSVAYKNVVGARRASLRIIGSIQNKEEQKGDSEKVNLISAYKGKVPPPPSPTDT